MRSLAAGQAGVVSRRQARDAGLSSSALTRRVAEGGWRVLHPGIYLVDNAPLTSMGRVWAAVLYAQSPARGLDDVPDAAIAGMAALWLAGAVDECPAVMEVAVPQERRVRSRAGVLVRRRVTLPVQQARQPPRLRLEDAMLDLVHRCTEPQRVVGLILTTGQRRLTTPMRVRLAVDARAQLRWRSLVLDLCQDLQHGVHSPLERRYKEVERRHGLPHGVPNAREDAPTGGSWYRDVRYEAQRLVVELDGRAAHAVEAAFRDRRRDNHAARRGETTLRYGWREVVSDPCGIAAEVAAVLTLAGWTGQPRACASGCAVGVRGAADRGGSPSQTGSDPPRSQRAG